MGTPRDGEPLETVSRPFDLTRNGFVLGEGAGALVVEDLEYARARGARIYAEVVGYGSAADAWDLIQPIEKGDGTRRAMEMALARHGVPRDEVDLINPHGTSTPLGDLREAQAIWAVFGEHTPHIAISGTKSMTGHLMGAAGAVEGVFTVLSVHHQVAPATLNYRDADPEIELDVVHGASRPMEIRYAMSDNIGLGGHNGAIIFKRYDGD
jgi:3-oxoacyl-[acyl-carrier-protein] synthase II